MTINRTQKLLTSTLSIRNKLYSLRNDLFLVFASIWDKVLHLVALNGSSVQFQVI